MVSLAGLCKGGLCLADWLSNPLSQIALGGEQDAWPTVGTLPQSLSTLRATMRRCFSTLRCGLMFLPCLFSPSPLLHFHERVTTCEESDLFCKVHQINTEQNTMSCRHWAAGQSSLIKKKKKKTFAKTVSVGAETREWPQWTSFWCFNVELKNWQRFRQGDRVVGLCDVRIFCNSSGEPQKCNSTEHAQSKAKHWAWTQTPGRSTIWVGCLLISPNGVLHYFTVWTQR